MPPLFGSTETTAERTESGSPSIRLWTWSTAAAWAFGSIVVVILRPPVFTTVSLIPAALSSERTWDLMSPFVPSATEPSSTVDGSMTCGYTAVSRCCRSIAPSVTIPSMT